jgi:pSer/pThr/pTyr-binding forkhead associated (FHA) protein
MSVHPQSDERSSLQVIPPDTSAEANPENFLPLRLTLQPGRRFVEIRRSEAILGRHSRADVRLPLPDVSRRHCRLFWCDSEWRVADLNSVNGTFVNDQAVETAPLRPGDALRIGGFTFLVGFAPASFTGGTGPFAEQSPGEEAVLRRIADALPSSANEPPLRRRAS